MLANMSFLSLKRHFRISIWAVILTGNASSANQLSLEYQTAALPGVGQPSASTDIPVRGNPDVLPGFLPKGIFSPTIQEELKRQAQTRSLLKLGIAKWLHLIKNLVSGQEGTMDNAQETRDTLIEKLLSGQSGQTDETDEVCQLRPIVQPLTDEEILDGQLQQQLEESLANQLQSCLAELNVLTPPGLSQAILHSLTLMIAAKYYQLVPEGAEGLMDQEFKVSERFKSEVLKETQESQHEFDYKRDKDDPDDFPEGHYVAKTIEGHDNLRYLLYFSPEKPVQGETPSIGHMIPNQDKDDSYISISARITKGGSAISQDGLPDKVAVLNLAEGTLSMTPPTLAESGYLNADFFPLSNIEAFAKTLHETRKDLEDLGKLLLAEDYMPPMTGLVQRTIPFKKLEDSIKENMEHEAAVIEFGALKYYTSRAGYFIKYRLALNKEKGSDKFIFRVSFKIAKGQFDHFLDWPFPRHQITFRIRNQKDSSRHLEKVYFTPDTRETSGETVMQFAQRPDSENGNPMKMVFDLFDWNDLISDKYQTPQGVAFQIIINPEAMSHSKQTQTDPEL